MSQDLQLKRSAVPGKIPTINDLRLGEIGINTYDGRIFLKQADARGERIIEIGTISGSIASQVSASLGAPLNFGFGIISTYPSYNASVPTTILVNTGSVTALSLFNAFTASISGSSSGVSLILFNNFTQSIYNYTSSINTWTSSINAWSSSINLNWYVLTSSFNIYTSSINAWTSSINTWSASLSSAGYWIRNQTSLQSSANFNIDGYGKAGYFVVGNPLLGFGGLRLDASVTSGYGIAIENNTYYGHYTRMDVGVECSFLMSGQSGGLLLVTYTDGVTNGIQCIGESFFQRSDFYPFINFWKTDGRSTSDYYVTYRGNLPGNGYFGAWTKNHSIAYIYSDDSFDAVAANRISYGINAYNGSTRSTGSNSLTNITVYAKAENAQYNYAGWFEGEVYVSSDNSVSPVLYVVGNNASLNSQFKIEHITNPALSFSKSGIVLRTFGMFNSNGDIAIQETADWSGTNRHIFRGNGDVEHVGGIKINTGLTNSDSIISGDTITNLFYVSASTDRIGINTNLPASDAILHIVGNTKISSSLLENITTGSFNTGSYIIHNSLTASYESIFMNYVITSGSNRRAGTFIATWLGTTTSYNDNSTTDLGNTNGVSFGVGITGSNASLIMFISGSNNWVIKSFYKNL